MALPKLVVTDIDGVWTDGGMYYDTHGNEIKKFNTSDSAGVLFCKLLGIEVAIITGEDTTIVKRRADKLKIEHLFMGVKDKKKVLTELTSRLGVTMDEVAYIGDDINDIEVLDMVGFSAAPMNAPDYIKKRCDLTTNTSGGDGAFREFVEHMLAKENKLDSVIEIYLNSKREKNEHEQ